MEQSEVVRQLNDLAKLHESGAITDDEFATAKARVLDGQRQGGVPPAPAPQPARPDSGGWHPPPQPEPGGWNAPPLLMPPRRPGATSVPTGQRVGHGGAITAGVGGLVALLAFFVMPMVTLPFLGSMTGAGFAGLASEEEEFALLWFVPLIAVTVVALAAKLALGKMYSARRRVGAVIVMVLAGLVVLACLIGLFQVQAMLSDWGASRVGVSAASVLGAGFWFVLIGMLAAGIGGYWELMSSWRLGDSVGGTASRSGPSSGSSRPSPS